MHGCLFGLICKNWTCSLRIRGNLLFWLVNVLEQEGLILHWQTFRSLKFVCLSYLHHSPYRFTTFITCLRNLLPNDRRVSIQFKTMKTLAIFGTKTTFIPQTCSQLFIPHQFSTETIDRESLSDINRICLLWLKFEMGLVVFGASRDELSWFARIRRTELLLYWYVFILIQICV